MALQFTVVRRKDMRKNAAADSKLFYGQTKASMKMDFDKFCEAVGDYCTASSADVKAGWMPPPIPWPPDWQKAMWSNFRIWGISRCWPAAGEQIRRRIFPL